jgi:hypothetical protein
MIGALSGGGGAFVEKGHHEQEIIWSAYAPSIQRRVQGQGSLGFNDTLKPAHVILLEKVTMSMPMEDDIKIWTAKPNAALVMEIDFLESAR